MTPFGLRKKLKSALGVGAQRSEIVEFSVTYVLPDGTEQTIRAEEGYSLLMASEKLSSPISNGRRAGGTCPDGLCATCRVEIIDGRGLSEKSEYEQAAMEALANGEPHEGRERAPGPAILETSRLACHTKIRGEGARVKVYALLDYDTLKGDPDGS